MQSSIDFMEGIEKPLQHPITIIIKELHHSLLKQKSSALYYILHPFMKIFTNDTKVSFKSKQEAGWGRLRREGANRAYNNSTSNARLRTVQCDICILEEMRRCHLLGCHLLVPLSNPLCFFHLTHDWLSS